MLRVLSTSPALRVSCAATVAAASVPLSHHNPQQRHFASRSNPVFQRSNSSTPQGSTRFTQQQQQQASSIGSASTSKASTLSSRWQTLPSFSEFHAKATEKVQNGGSRSSGEGGGRASGWWWRRPVAFLLANAGGLIAYEMFLETLVSGTFAGILLNQYCTIDELRAKIEASGYPFTDMFEWEGAVYTEGIKVPPFLRGLVLALGGTGKEAPGSDAVVMDAYLCTVLHTSHNISMGFMPAMLVFLFATFPVARRAWPAVRGLITRIPVLGLAFRPMAMPAEVLGAVNRSVGTSLGSAAMGGAGTVGAQTARKAGAAGSGASKSGASSSAKWRK